MPTYEMPLLLRVMTRPEVTTVLKRVTGVIFSKGGFLRKIEHLGQKATPYKIRAHGTSYQEADYFVLQFDAPPRSLDDMSEEYSRDLDIIKKKIYKAEKEPVVPCTLHEELLPPPYRPPVIKLMGLIEKQDKTKHGGTFKHRPVYHPFQK